MEIEFLKGYSKVDHRSSCICISVFYNPITKDEIRLKTDDIDYYAYADQAYSALLKDREEADEVQREPIDKEIQALYLHRKGIILLGDRIVVARGRKIPKGTTGKFVSERDFKDRYGRVQTTYYEIELEDGTTVSTSCGNCDLVWEDVA